MLLCPHWWFWSKCLDGDNWIDCYEMSVWIVITWSRNKRIIPHYLCFIIFALSIFVWTWRTLHVKRLEVLSLSLSTWQKIFVEKLLVFSLRNKCWGQCFINNVAALNMVAWVWYLFLDCWYFVFELGSAAHSAPFSISCLSGCVTQQWRRGGGGGEVTKTERSWRRRRKVGEDLWWQQVRSHCVTDQYSDREGLSGVYELLFLEIVDPLLACDI